MVVDVENPEVQMLTESVQAMPTIEVYQNGERTQTLQGFQKEKVKEVLEELAREDRESNA